MESIATVLYLRLRNVLAICNGMTPERAAALVEQLRSILEGPVAKQNGIVAMVRHDSILAVFSNDQETVPDHARRALHAAVLAVYETMEMSKQLAMRADTAAAPQARESSPGALVPWGCPMAVSWTWSRLPGSRRCALRGPLPRSIRRCAMR